jgi:HK97 family phage prohead protease
MTTRKTFSRVEIKDADKGQVTAAFSTFDVIDKDMDVTRPGAFDEGVKVVISAYGHTSWDGALPVGSGTIQATKTEAILDGQFFLDTLAGADTFTAVKRLAADGLGEWSYGYDPIEYSFGEFNDQRVRFLDKLKVYEVSPVLVGAGVNTRTLAAKGLRFDEHGQALLDELDDFIDRAMRAAKDKPLRRKSTALLQQVDDRLKTLHEMLGKSTPDSDSDAETLRQEFLRFMARPLAS